MSDIDVHVSDGEGGWLRLGERPDLGCLVMTMPADAAVLLSREDAVMMRDALATWLDRTS